MYPTKMNQFKAQIEQIGQEVASKCWQKVSNPRFNGYHGSLGTT